MYFRYTAGNNFHTTGASSEGSRVQLPQRLLAAVYSVRVLLLGNVQFLIMKEYLLNIGMTDSSAC